MKEFNIEELRLGGDILENALHGCYSEEALLKYQRILSMPGIDGALYLLYKAIQHDVTGNAKVLSQAAFVLGYFVCTSMQAVDALWANGPEEEPELNEGGE